MDTVTRVHDTPPSALAYMLQAFRPSPGWQATRRFPDLQMSWRDFRVDTNALDDLARIAGAPAGADALTVLYPQVTGFRLLMAMLTHPAWPLPVWGALQVRNRLQWHRPVRRGESFTLYSRADAWRVLEKGIEVDLHSRLVQGGDCAWESVVTFYYRGRFGSPAEQGVARGAPAVSPAVDKRCAEIARWQNGSADRWRFGALTGDYNGIHQWDAYARRFGFPAAFAHPQRMAAQCLLRLASHAPQFAAAPQQVDLWLKGPVYYGRDVNLRAAVHGGDRCDFALALADDPRPALIGSLRKPAGAG